MVALRNLTTGVVVNVSDDKAERFDSSWVLADGSAPEADDKPAKKTTAAKTTPRK